MCPSSLSLAFRLLLSPFFPRPLLARALCSRSIQTSSPGRERERERETERKKKSERENLDSFSPPLDTTSTYPSLSFNQRRSFLPLGPSDPLVNAYSPLAAHWALNPKPLTLSRLGRDASRRDRRVRRVAAAPDDARIGLCSALPVRLSRQPLIAEKSIQVVQAKV